METHAWLILANDIESANLPREYRSESADVRHLYADSLSVAEARKLRQEAASGAFQADKLVFVVVAKSMTHEAQNALLKLFEEPSGKVTFFLVIPYESLLLPTLRSRLILKEGNGKEDLKDARDFLASNYKERLEIAADLAKNQPANIGGLIRDITKLAKPSWNAAVKKTLLLADNYVYNRGAAKKMLLEDVALTLPIETR